MCAEGAGIEYHQAQALVKKYTDKRSALARGMLTEPPPPTEDVAAVEQRILQHNGETFVCDPVPAQPSPTEVLGELLEAARKAELRYLEADAKYKQAMIEHAEAANAAGEAWHVFNNELRASMPEVSRLLGVKWLDQPTRWANNGRTVSS